MSNRLIVRNTAFWEAVKKFRKIELKNKVYRNKSRDVIDDKRKESEID